MRDTDYAFCVARIRACETKLLSKEFIDKLIDAEDYSSSLRMLTSAGWIESGTENEDFIRKQSSNLWQLLSESVPEKQELDGLCLLNDYFNIKTAIKCIVAGEKAEAYFVEPSSLDLNNLSESIDSRSYAVLKNDKMRQTAKSAFETACITNDGQSAEIIIDVAALEALLELSLRSRHTTFSKICGFIVDVSNIRTAIRCAKTGKNAGFIDSAVSACCKINRDLLVSEAAKGQEALLSYLMTCDYAEGAELYITNPVLYDKWCDSKILEIATESGYTAFGFSPVCAYYYKKTDEIKTVKLILSAKKSGISADLLRERVKVAYA